jgi:hypothetical protein
MAPHINHVTNGQNDWVMKTKITMDEVYGYSGDDKPAPYHIIVCI